MSNEPNSARRGREIPNPKLEILKACNGRKMDAEMRNEANFTIGKIGPAFGRQLYWHPGGSLKQSPGIADVALPRAAGRGLENRRLKSDADAGPAGLRMLDNGTYSGYSAAVDTAHIVLRSNITRGG